MRPFFHRAWKRDFARNSGSNTRSDPFASASVGCSGIGHRRVTSLSDLALDDLGDDAASRESQQGIVRTVEVTMDWKSQRSGSHARMERQNVVPHDITDSEQ
jgi:hypothetical protein